MANLNARGTLGNKSRTGMPKPPGSGQKPLIGTNVTSFTFRVGMHERVLWQQIAQSRGTTTGALIREIMAEFIEGGNV